MKQKLIRVDIEDDKLMMSECKELYLKFHPDLKDYNIGRVFMFKKVIQHYVKP